MRFWKVLGIAAFAGVAAGGALIARDERRRQAYTPGEVRDRLHARIEEESTPDGGERVTSADDAGAPASS